jgi:Ergosterol biosynthesis ERG4/ERG24 family
VSRAGVSVCHGSCHGFAGFVSMWIMFALTAVVHFQFRSLSWVHDNLLALATAAVTWSLLLSVYLYVSSFSGKRVLADGGNTGAFAGTLCPYVPQCSRPSPQATLCTTCTSAAS